MNKIESEHILNELKLLVVNNYREIVIHQDISLSDKRKKLAVMAKNDVTVHFEEILQDMINEQSNSKELQVEITRVLTNK